MGAEETLFQRFGKEFPKGTTLFREGEAGKDMFVLQSGRIAISKRVRDVEKTLAVLGPGEFFGEMGVLERAPRNATVVAKTRMTLLTLSSWDVKRLESKSPDAYRQLQDVIQQRRSG